MSELVVIRLGKITYSNCECRKDVMLKRLAHRHLFWRFWWCVEPTDEVKYLTERVKLLEDENLMLQERISDYQSITEAQENLITAMTAEGIK